MRRLLKVLAAGFLAATGASTSLAGTQTKIAEIGLPTAIVSVKASADGKRLVVQLQSSAMGPGGLQIVDVTNPDRPLLRGFVQYDKSGELAVSPDGRRAVLAVADESKKYGEAGKHRLAVFDLTSADAPKKIEEQDFAATAIALADDAGAYAISSPDTPDPKRGGNRGQTIVHWLDGKKKSVKVIEGGDPGRPRKLSADGSFLAIQGYGEIAVYRLDPGGVSRYDQESAYPERYRCMLSVLPTGRVVVQNSSFGYLESLAFESGLPRSHRIHSSEEFCSSLGGDASATYYGAYTGHVIRLRTDRRGRLSLDGDWWFPREHMAVAAAKNLVFAVSNDSKVLQIHRLDTTTATVDWRALEEIHHEILASYREARAAKKYSADRDAVNQFVKAGGVAAIESGEPTIAPQRGAAVLNDFGFFAARAGYYQLAEQALRRAIALDPGRALAHLNLADLLRQQWHKAGSPLNKRFPIREIQHHYRRYLAAGGQRTEAISRFLRSDLDAKNGNLCETIANFSNAGRLDELVSSTGVGIPLPDGRKIDIAFTTEGTAHVPAYAIYDTATGFPLNASSEAPALAQFPEGLWGGIISAC